MFTDSKSLCDNISKYSNSKSKRVTIDIQRIRKAYDLGKISKIVLYHAKAIQRMHLLKWGQILYCKVPFCAIAQILKPEENNGFTVGVRPMTLPFPKWRQC